MDLYHARHSDVIGYLMAGTTMTLTNQTSLFTKSRVVKEQKMEKHIKSDIFISTTGANCNTEMYIFNTESQLYCQRNS